MDDFSQWVGREETRIDRVEPGVLDRWVASLDWHGRHHTGVPHGFHWCLCPPQVPTAELGRDGHPDLAAPASFLPPVPLPRRMWASSELEFIEPLQRHDVVTRTSRIEDIRQKSGKSGQLVFVDVSHSYTVDGSHRIRELQSIVYRDAARSSHAPDTRILPSADDGWCTVSVAAPTEVLLFRYSALTFNSHRIHYDLNYATNTEGYPGLVVQGPLIATLLLDLATTHLRGKAIRNFRFRGVSPAYAGDALRLSVRETGEELELAAASPLGNHVMLATAS
jgi:3-methylfumaryl-CoA hydratase